jgi:hypothetical protein
MDISVPIVGFIFVCVIFPHVVKHKPQFYMAFAVVLVILVLNIIVNVVDPLGGAARFFRVLRDVLWIVDLILLALASGGLSMHQLTGEFKNAYEVMRRGETTPTVIIPERDNPYAKVRSPDLADPSATAAPTPSPVGPPSPNSPTNSGGSIPLA